VLIPNKSYVIRRRHFVSIPISVLYLMIPLVLGIISGYLLRFGIGANNELLTAMPQVGFQSLVISVLAILFSIAFVIAGRRLVKR